MKPTEIKLEYTINSVAEKGVLVMQKFIIVILIVTLIFKLIILFIKIIDDNFFLLY